LNIPEACAEVQGDNFLRVTPFAKLSQPSSLCGLAERCIGVESVRALLNDLSNLKPQILALVPKGGSQEAVERFFTSQQGVVAQLRTFVLSCAAIDVLTIADVGRISLENFTSTVASLKWDIKDFQNGSPATPYLDQLRVQIEDLARRIPCAGGGSVPFSTQRLLWGWLGARVAQECAEVIARCGRKKSQEALFKLAEDFRNLRTVLDHQLKPVEGQEDELLLPKDHPLGNTATWAYLDGFLEVHAWLPTEADSWCKEHPEYPLRLHKALMEYLHNNAKAQKEHLGRLEVHISNYINEEIQREQHEHSNWALV
jgi:hypothetical protein